MPQREFWSTRHPSGITWSYHVDLAAPERKPAFVVNVYDQAHGSMDSGMAYVPLNTVHEAMSGLLVATWEAYLFGETGDVNTTTRSHAQRWAEESAIRASHLG